MFSSFSLVFLGASLGHVKAFERKYLPINYEKEYFLFKFVFISFNDQTQGEMMLMASALRILEKDDERMKSTKLLILNILKINIKTEWRPHKHSQVFSCTECDDVIQTNPIHLRHLSSSRFHSDDWIWNLLRLSWSCFLWLTRREWFGRGKELKIVTFSCCESDGMDLCYMLHRFLNGMSQSMMEIFDVRWL
jgi:hypothetical protein